MSKLVAILLLALVASVSAQESVLIDSQNFEANDWQTDFTGSSTWTDHVARTTSNPYLGSYSLRWNQYDGVTDPITGLLAEGNPLLDWRGSTHNFAALTSNGAYFRMSFRHDDYHNEVGSAGSRKLFYIVDQVFGVSGMFIKQQHGARTVELAAYNGFQDSAQAAWYSSNWGYYSLPLLDGPSASLDGDWHTFAIYFNYTEKYMQFWMDDILLRPYNGSNDSDSYQNNFPQMYIERKLPWHPDVDFNTKGFQIMYYRASSDAVNVSNETGYYSGIQIDNLEFWDGIPDSTYVPPESPTTITRPDELQVVE